MLWLSAGVSPPRHRGIQRSSSPTYHVPCQGPLMPSPGETVLGTESLGRGCVLCGPIGLGLGGRDERPRVDTILWLLPRGYARGQSSTVSSPHLFPGTGVLNQMGLDAPTEGPEGWPAVTTLLRGCWWGLVCLALLWPRALETHLLRGSTQHIALPGEAALVAQSTMSASTSHI